MTSIDPNGRAELVETIHQPWKATVRDCLDRWRAAGAATRANCYLILHEDEVRRRTLNAAMIAELDAMTRVAPPRARAGQRPA